MRTLKKPVSVKFELKVVKENGKERQAFSDQTYRYEDGTKKIVPMVDEDRKYFDIVVRSAHQIQCSLNGRHPF